LAATKIGAIVQAGINEKAFLIYRCGAAQRQAVGRVA
jgi:hypothetical protein